MEKNTKKSSIWKREVIRFGELSIPIWALLSMLLVSVTAAATVVIYNAVVAQVVQPANVLPPISISLYTGNYNTGAFNTLVANSLNSAVNKVQVSGGNAIIYGVNTINNANREVNTTLVDIITSDPSSASNTLFPINVYYLGSSYNAIYVPNGIATTSNILQTNITHGDFLNILNALQTNTLQSGFYTYNIPANSYLNPTSNIITVTNWIGGQAYNSISSNPSNMYYYLLSQSDLTGTANTPQVGMPSIPANAFRYYPSGVQPSSVIGFVVPSSFNGYMTFTLKAVASSRALVANTSS